MASMISGRLCPKREPTRPEALSRTARLSTSWKQQPSARGDETRIFLELPVARVRHPASVEVRQVMLPFFSDSGFGRVPRGIDFHRSSTVTPLCELCPAPGHVWSVQNRPSLHCRHDVTSSLTDAAAPTGGHSHDHRADAYGLQPERRPLRSLRRDRNGLRTDRHRSHVVRRVIAGAGRGAHLSSLRGTATRRHT